MPILGAYFGLSIVPSQNSPQNRHKPTSEIGFSRGGFMPILETILGDDSQVSSTDSFTDRSSIHKICVLYAVRGKDCGNYLIRR